MAMSIGDANDVQTILQHLGARKVVKREQFLDAVERLGDRSTRILMAGNTGDELRARINRRKGLGFSDG